MARGIRDHGCKNGVNMDLLKRVWVSAEGRAINVLWFQAHQIQKQALRKGQDMDIGLWRENR